MPTIIELRDETGLLHCEYGPAYKDEFGTFWFKHGLYHRLDGPAADQTNGLKIWYVNGKPHRLDGPALEFLSGNKEWWINGKQIHVKSQEEFERYLKLIVFI